MNVILIALESTAAQYLKLYGAAEDPMPNLTRLADHSIVFEHAYTVYPESIKGLFSVLCSQYPALDIPAETLAERRTPCVAQSLADAGYRTALFHAGRFGYLGMEGIVRNRGFQTLEDAGNISGNMNSSFGVDEPAVVDRILKWIDQSPQGKFFITYLPIAGHHPYATPEAGPFGSDTQFENYLNALHYGDASIDTLLQGLRDRGLDKNTVFVLYGDHGEAFLQHEGNVGHSMFIYEENVRVPFVIASEKLFTEQIRVRRTASLIDTAPTILDLLGFPVPARFSGTSLLGSPNDMALFFTDYSLKFLGLRDGCWKYIYETDSDRSRLYDLCTDPTEVTNVESHERARESAYRARVRDWMGLPESTR
jgi:arylsulfatase A-like enzyme